MIDLILYNNFFISFLSVLLYINIILTNCTDKSDKEEKAKKIKQNEIERFKNKTIDLFLVILFIILIYISFKIKSIFAVFMSFTILLSFSRIFRNYIKEALDLDFHSKHNYLAGTTFFIILFSAKSCDIYITSFSALPHTAKEILLLMYLVLKIIFVVFFILMNFSILISNIQMIFGKYLSKLFNKIKEVNITYSPKYYNFYFSSIWNKKMVITIDKIIFFITCPIFMIVNIIFRLLIAFIDIILNSITKVYKFLLNYNDNRNTIIKTIIKISLIISLIIVYICTIYDKIIFSNQIKEIYNLIVTVLLIPIIYDSIKEKSNK